MSMGLWGRIARSHGWLGSSIQRKIACGVLVLLAVPVAWIVWLGPPLLGKDLDISVQVVDREGRLLRAYTTVAGRWRLPATTEAVDLRYLEAVMAYEDKRFRQHRGVDLLALMRAAGQLVRSGRIISGASTLTMQVVRLMEPRHERSVLAKLREIVRALELESNLTKQEILTLYLNLAPYGGNLEGVRAGSLAYFGHEPTRLSLSEIGLLVALPQSPELRRPDRSAEAARLARDRVLDRLLAVGLATAREFEQAKREPVPTGRQPLPMLSPHAADQAVAAAPKRKLHRLSIDAGLQRTLEALLRDRSRDFDSNISMALVAVNVATAEVVARIGSVDYFDAGRAGQLDISRAVRSPGSTLKPFIYGMAFEDGIIHPETLINDRPTRYGNYAPKNFDLKFQGYVSVRHALQLSLNLPAIAVLNAVGPDRLVRRLKEAGGTLVLPKGEPPGLALGLGGIGISLKDLTMLYADIARLGAAAPLIERRDRAPSAAHNVLLDPVAAWYVGNILMETPPPKNAVGGRIAFKTGTSYGYRDAWSIGFDGKSAVGVWVGRPDGASVPGLIGRTAAAPILFDAFSRIDRPFAPLPPAPKGTLTTKASKLPPTLVQFPPALLVNKGSPPPRIMFPPDGAHLDIASPDAEGSTALPLKISGGVGPLTVLVNGLPAFDPSPKRTFFWEPDGPGFARLTVMDSRGAADSVVVWVEKSGQSK
jgi:penicillin-binding protein 1C